MAKAQIEIFDDTLWDTQVRTPKDAFAERPPRQFVIHPFLPESSLNVFYGTSGDLKSMVVVDLAACCLCGENWLIGEEFAGFKTERCAVLWIDVDNGRDVMDERMAAALRGHAKNIQQALAVPLRYLSFPNPSFHANNDAAVNAIIRKINQWNIRLVVFDNLAMVSGGAEENTAQMADVMKGLRFIAEKTKVAVIVIHHNPKNDKSKDSLRGHTSIIAALNHAYWVQRDDEVITITPTKVRTKPIDPISGIFQFEAKGDILHRFVFEGIEPELNPITVKARQKLGEHLKKAKEANQSDLVKALKGSGVGRTRAIAEINSAVRHNLLLVKSGQARNQKLYTLSTTPNKK